ncbi:MAG: hypothetical protein O7C75_08555 [Verrucomicrobia bacterium]|nr:hypothetical protein [Verrucomicrobiota bacterium]
MNDLVHSSVFPVDVFGPVSGMLAQVPVVITITITFDAKVRAKVSRYSWLHQWKSQGLLNFGYGVAALSSLVSRSKFVAVFDAVKRSVSKDLHLPPGRIEVIHWGLIPEQYGDTELNSRDFDGLKE